MCCQFTATHSFSETLNDSRLNELWHTLLETNYKLKIASDELTNHGIISQTQKSDLSFFTQVNAYATISQALNSQVPSQRQHTLTLIKAARELRDASREYLISRSNYAAAEKALNDEEIREDIDPVMTIHSTNRSQCNNALKLRDQKRKKLASLVGEKEVALIDQDLD